MQQPSHGDERAAFRPATDEQEMLRQLMLATDDRPSWTSRSLLGLMEQKEQGYVGAGPRWARLKSEIPNHTQWPRGRLIALVTRLQDGADPSVAGSSELLHAED